MEFTTLFCYRDNYSFRQWRVQVQVLRLFYLGGLVSHWYAISIDSRHKVQSPLGG